MASRALRDVTNYKGTRLVEQQARFEECKQNLLNEAGQSADPVGVLLDGLEKLGFKGTLEPISYSNIRMMHRQSQHDTSVPSTLMNQWRNDLERLLDIQSTKHEYAALFSKLATEWVDKPNDANLLLDSSLNDATTESESGDFNGIEAVRIGREEMYRQRQQWDSFVFTERRTDTAAIKRYLTDIFIQSQENKRITKTPFEQLREEIGKFNVEGEGDVPMTCKASSVENCIKAVLKADVFTGKKRDDLLSLKDAPSSVLKEVADVMNMGLSSLDSWEWKPSPIPANMRRQLNGKYRVFMEPEVHQALLVQLIGTHFAFRLKRIFTGFYRSKAWPKSPHNSMSNTDRTRASFYVDVDRTELFQESVLFARKQQYEKDFFMTQLPSSLREGNREYSGMDDMDVDDDSDEEVESQSPLDVKQTLLHLATTELILQKKIYGSFTLCKTDFKWFGPSLPHDTIFAVLEFLGVNEKWLNFFRKFLSTPLTFPQDGPDAEPRTRLCGVPINQTLSDALGEALLFCLDFAVSKATGGSCPLYRFHDDVWFWGQEKDCEIAWQTIDDFTKVMGLELNEEKTGSVHVSDKNHQPSEILPRGPVRWGFLELDAAQARWVVDMKQVDEHIVEIRRQFAQCRSVFSWVQAWNSYVSSFLRNNFGHAANCLGSEHIDMVFSTFKYIQQNLFVDDGSGMGDKDVTSYLKTTIGKCFGAKDIANAFLYWPTELGGLDLRNPFVPLLTVRHNSMDNPASCIDKAFEEDEELYEEAKKEFLRGKHGNDVPRGCDPDTFFSFEEYVRFREETSVPLLCGYMKLLESPDAKGLDSTRACDNALESLPLDLQDSKHMKEQWSDMDIYWRWMLQLYGGEVMERFGGIVLGEKDFLPVGLVNLMKSERVRWQG